MASTGMCWCRWCVLVRLFAHRPRCRRVERRCVQMASEQAIPADAIAWLNRLSDFLFTAARVANAVAGVPDIPWKPADPGSLPEAKED